MLVGDDRDQPAGDRVLDLLADERRVALVIGVNRDRHVGEHRLGPGGRDLDRAAAVGERVAQCPELALDVASLDFEVADRGLELRVPIHQPLVAVGEAALVELDEDVGDGALVALVHGEALVRPVARRAEAAELAGDRAARSRAFHSHTWSRNASRLIIGALDALALEVALDHHLRGDAGMVGADHPQGVLAEHPLAPRQHVLQRDVERVADVQAAGDVGRRHDDRPRLGVAALGPEQARAPPNARTSAPRSPWGRRFWEGRSHEAVSDAALQHQPDLSLPACSGRAGPGRSRRGRSRLRCWSPDRRHNRPRRKRSGDGCR